jgi:hypothetical protein
MTNVDPLIQRELSSMELGVFANRDLTPLVIAKVRQHKIRRAIFAISVVIGLLLIASLSFGVVRFMDNHSLTTSGGNAIVPTSNGVTADEIKPAISKYKIDFEPNTGDSGAISNAAGLGGTLLSLTATGVKVDWATCPNNVHCPSQLTLTLKNGGNEIVPAKIAVSVFLDHTSVSYTAKPTSVTAGGSSIIIVPLPEIARMRDLTNSATWQWNWYLVPNN